MLMYCEGKIINIEKVVKFFNRKVFFFILRQCRGEWQGILMVNLFWDIERSFDFLRYGCLVVSLKISIFFQQRDMFFIICLGVWVKIIVLYRDNLIRKFIFIIIFIGRRIFFGEIIQRGKQEKCYDRFSFVDWVEGILCVVIWVYYFCRFGKVNLYDTL